MDDLLSRNFELTRLLLQRGTALIYLIAFLVAYRQFCALCGVNGLEPIGDVLRNAGWRNVPSIFVFLPLSDTVYKVSALIGIALSCGLLIGLADNLPTLLNVLVWLALWLLYLSFVNAACTFYGFGWESILLEAGFLAAFLGPAHVKASPLIIWLWAWLLFRVMFGAGLIKIRADSCWRDLTCLYYHYETQPMPNPLSLYFHAAPRWFHRFGVLFTHFVELVVPWFYFAPAPLCYIAGIFTILFQLTLILSGNLSWLNYVTIVIAFSCFDDRLLSRVFTAAAAGARSLVFDAALWLVFGACCLMSVNPVRNMLSKRQLMNFSFNRYHLVGTYGAFGAVGRQREEVIIEGTRDEVPDANAHWREYELKGKPGNPRARPPIVAPYHHRLDWQLWFVPMRPAWQSPWLLQLIEKLLASDEATLSLFKHNPFPDAPPNHIRVLLYRYRFSTPAEKRETGNWWQRELVGELLPPMSRLRQAAPIDGF